MSGATTNATPAVAPAAPAVDAAAAPAQTGAPSTPAPVAPAPTAAPPDAAVAPSPGDAGWADPALAPKAPEPPAAKTPEEIAAAAAAYEIPEALTKEGFTKEDPTVKAYLEQAAELGLPQEAVVKLMEKVTPAIREALQAPQKAWDTLKGQWTAEIKADPVIGGGKLEATVATISQGIAAYAKAGGGDAAAVAAREAGVWNAMRITGAGFNPEVARVLYFAFSRITEGSHVAGNPAGGAPKAAAELLFNNPTSRAGAPSQR